MRVAGIVLLMAAPSHLACKAPPDYGAFLDHHPASILVLPPLNETADVNAADAFLSTVSTALAECGYYVFPIAVVDRMMKENGRPTPGEMHRVPLEKIQEVFGADAVLFVVIKTWTTQYLVFDTSTTVRLEYRLVDVDTGTELWRQERTFTRSSSSGAPDPVSAILVALVTAVVSAVSAPEWGLATRANRATFEDAGFGLLRGPRHPEFESHRRRKLAERKPPGDHAPPRASNHH